jgi:hypothetical protein
MKRDFELIIITVYGIFIKLRNEPNLTFLNVPQLKNIDMIWCSYGRFFIT